VFGVLLPETELHGARQLANGLCAHISMAPHDFGLCRIILTLSIGIASGVPDALKSFKDLLETAESALYVAHSSHGNQVQTAMMS
jgi:PleD family two-component response regulator